MDLYEDDRLYVLTNVYLGNVVYNHPRNGELVKNIDTFVSLPLEDLLKELDLDERTLLSKAEEDPTWKQRFAIAQVIKKLYNKK